MKCSVIIVAKGNPKRLFACVDSIYEAVTEVVIVDIGLESAVCERLSHYQNLRIQRVTEEIPYVELIREKSKTFAKEEYVLFLDPDEIVPDSLLAKLESAIGAYDYVRVPRKNIIFGKWIQHSRWYPDYQTRFFRKSAVSWPKTIHVQPETSGKVLSLDPVEELSLIHHNYESVSEYLEKLVRYTKAEAVQKQGEDYLLSQAFSDGLSDFMSRYFAGKGYKDGTHGLVLALLQLFYHILVWVWVWEANKYPEIKQEGTESVYRFFKQGAYETGHWGRQLKLLKQTVKRHVEHIVLKP